jgi:hypothetical protein
VPAPGTQLVIGGQRIDLCTRVLVAGVVPPPRFGRESEVLATAATVRAAGADLVDVSLPPRLSGPVARAGDLPVAMRAGTAAEAAAARRAGAQVVLVPPDAAADAASEAGAEAGAVAVVVDDLAEVSAAQDVAGRLGAPLAIDASHWSGPEAVGKEAAAVSLGCRVIRTTDVRRSRRVAEVMAALLAARREDEGS